MYASLASSVGLGGPPAPAHIVSSMKIGPRGVNGASPFMNAQPERDIDSTPPASPTESSSLRIACAIEIAPDSDEAQKRLTVIAGTESGKTAARAAQRATSPIPSWAGFTQPALMSSMRSSGTPPGLRPRVARQHPPPTKKSRNHRLPEEVVHAQMRQRAPVAAHGRAHATEDEGISHRNGPPCVLRVVKATPSQYEGEGGA